MTDAPTSSGGPRRAWLWGGAAAVVLLALVVWLLVRGGDDGSGKDAASPTSGSPSSVPSTTVDAEGSPLPSKSPGQTEPTEVVKPGKSTKPVRAGLTEPAALGTGLTAEVTRIEAVKGVARGTGESGGPSLRFTITVSNDSDRALSTVASVLTAYYGDDDTPANDLSAPGVRLLPDEIGAGRSATGVYVFRIPPEARDQIRLDFTYNNDLPTAIFRGAA